MVSEKIKSLRKQAKMSQDALAEKLNVSRQAITKWETGVGIPDVDNLIAIANLFLISLDELMEREITVVNTSEFLFESKTEYDIDGKKDFDITFMGAKDIVLCSYEGEKVEVILASNQITNLKKAFKTKIDDNRKRMDINVKRSNEVTEMEAKADLNIVVKLPQDYIGRVELEGNTERLLLENITGNIEFCGKVKQLEIMSLDGHAEINSNEDMKITCRSVTGNLDINQISATSKIFISSDIKLQTVTKGIANRMIMNEGLKSLDEDANLVLELNGMKSELVLFNLDDKASV